jgi:hypothetical protein
MSRSSSIPQPISEKYLPLTKIKRGNHTSHLPKKFAEVNAALARAALIQGAKGQ